MKEKRTNSGKFHSCKHTRDESNNLKEGTECIHIIIYNKCDSHENLTATYCNLHKCFWGFKHEFQVYEISIKQSKHNHVSLFSNHIYEIYFFGIDFFISLSMYAKIV